MQNERRRRRRNKKRRAVPGGGNHGVTNGVAGMQTDYLHLALNRLCKWMRKQFKPLDGVDKGA